MKIIVMAGGASGERAVSLQSGRCVAQALHHSGHQIAFCDPALPASAQEIIFFSPQEPLPNPAPPRAPLSSLFDPALLPKLRKADVVFLALHGGQGEDGTLQSLLQACGIPYTHASPLPCRLAMDKSVSKELWQTAKIPTPSAVLLEATAITPPPELCYPCVLKPLDGGSSLGVQMVQNQAQMADFLAHRAPDDRPLLAETYIKGREFSVGILDGCALPPVEIVADGYYDYTQKYCENGAQEICPAPLTAGESDELCRLAERAAAALRFDAVCRIDFLQSAQNGQFYCLEANALPGMTARSLLPMTAAAAGISFAALCNLIAHDGANHARTGGKR